MDEDGLHSSTPNTVVQRKCLKMEEKLETLKMGRIHSFSYKERAKEMVTRLIYSKHPSE